MQLHTVYLYLETALHVSGGTSTHHQERKQLYLQYLVFVTPLLLSAVIVEELEPMQSCNRCKLIIEFIIAKFPERSTCFERHTVHHQELQTLLAATGLYTHVVTGRCPG
jgi:hypothetical protein